MVRLWHSQNTPGWIYIVLNLFSGYSISFIFPNRWPILVLFWSWCYSGVSFLKTYLLICKCKVTIFMLSFFLVWFVGFILRSILCFVFFSVDDCYSNTRIKQKYFVQIICAIHSVYLFLSSNDISVMNLFMKTSPNRL